LRGFNGTLDTQKNKALSTIQNNAAVQSKAMLEIGEDLKSIQNFLETVINETENAENIANNSLTALEQRERLQAARRENRQQQTTAFSNQTTGINDRNHVGFTVRG